MIKNTFLHIGIFFLYLLSLLPLSALYGLAFLLYYPLYYLIGYRKKVVRENLIKSFPEKNINEIKKIEKHFYRHFAELTVEIIKMASISKAEVNKRYKFLNLEMIESYYDKGESILASTGHYLNWELGMLAFSTNDGTTHQPYVIYKPLSNKIFDAWLMKLRTRFGNKMVAMNQTLRKIASTRSEVTMFCFASDQTPGKQEIQYNLQFLNQKTPVLLGLEKIALQTNRPVFYFDIKKIKKGYYEIECIPLALNPKETSAHEITTRFFELLTTTIHREPAYWLWSHRRWKYSN